jgi:hypothetical protein
MRCSHSPSCLQTPMAMFHSVLSCSALCSTLCSHSPSCLQTPMAPGTALSSRLVSLLPQPSSDGYRTHPHTVDKLGQDADLQHTNGRSLFGMCINLEPHSVTVPERQAESTDAEVVQLLFELSIFFRSRPSWETSSQVMWSCRFFPLVTSSALDSFKTPLCRASFLVPGSTRSM